MTDLAAGTVTVADLYRELVGMRSDLSRVLAHQEAVDIRMVASDGQHTDHEARIRALEKFRYTIAGVALIGGVASGWVGYLLGHLYH